MAILTRDQILTAPDLKSERLAVPEWGGEVIVRGMTGAERDAFEGATVELRGKRASLKFENIRARLVSLTVVDEDGKRIFGEADIAALGQKSAQALDRVFSAAQRLSGLSKEDIEELAKN